MLFAFCFQHIAYCIPPITSCIIHFAYCFLHIASCILLIAFCFFVSRSLIIKCLIIKDEASSIVVCAAGTSSFARSHK